MSREVTDLVLSIFAAYRTGDEKAGAALLSEDFTFTSPRDDRIDKATYFQRCWANRDKIRSHRIEKLFVSENEAFVRYECELTTGARFRNTEFFRIENHRIKEVEVYFGASLQGPSEG